MIARRMEIVIATPEGVRFGLPLAGPVTRFLAWVVDALAIFAVISVLLKLLSAFGLFSRDWMTALGTIAYFAVSIGYGMAFESYWNGQTPGKRVMHLRVVDTGGLKLTISQVAIRNLLRAIDTLPLLYLVGGASLLFTRDAQRLGDLAAGTAVIQLNPVSPFDAAPLAAGKYNSLLAYPHLVARLRQKASPELVELAAQALSRREELLPQARIEVFEELALRFRALVEFPEEALQGLAGEQYVRAAVTAIIDIAAAFNCRP